MVNVAELIAHPEQLDKDSLYELRELVAKYPYYQAARLLFLRTLFLLHDPTFGEELRKAAVFLPDRRVLFAMVEGDNYTIKPQPLHVHEEPVADQGKDRTQSLIDDFLSTTDEAQPARPGRKPTAADATTDYAAFLLDMEDAEPVAPEGENGEPARSETLIDDFIGKGGERIQLKETPEFTPEVETEEGEAEEAADEGYLTMTLAKIYIKQQRYEKALEIMRKVNSANPKKSSYFADQIRFLQKLIVNKNHQNQ